MRRRLWIVAGGVGLVAIVLVVVLVVGSGPSPCQAEADRVVAALANPLGPTPPLGGLTRKDAATVRTLLHAFQKTYNSLSTTDPVQARERRGALPRWKNVILPEVRIGTLAEGGCYHPSQ